MHTRLHAGAALRREHAYGELKDRLLAGEFRLNARLKEVSLASLLGVSRTPIREALLRLHAEGIVERQKDGGFVPVVPDVDLVRSLYEVRVGLEVLALRRPHDVDLVRAVVDEWEGFAVELPEAGPTFVLADESFHVAIAEAAGNDALVEVLVQINERIRTVRMTDFLTPDRIASTVAEHLGIARALLDGDVVSAELRLLGHVDDSQAVVERRVAEAITRMAAVPDVEVET